MDNLTNADNWSEKTFARVLFFMGIFGGILLTLIVLAPAYFITWFWALVGGWG